MKRIMFIVFAFMLISSVSFAAPSYVSSNAVSFNTTAVIVTFNSVVNSLLIVNESATDNADVTLTGLGWTSPLHTTYIIPVARGVSPSAVAVLPISSAVRIKANSSLSVDVNTNKIGFIKPATSVDSGNCYYLVTSEQGQP